MSNLVIVAIPSEDDYVWKISSEKKPHMTLLFLGDVAGKPVNKISDFLEHAVNILEFGPFGLSVDYRGTLGADDADVLFFRNDWGLKRIAEFRDQLLKNNPIRDAYDSASQFGAIQEWTPHLTLGYPKTPAKKDTRDYPGFHWVEFDRIALWYGDFEGPEFRLQYDYDFAEVAMSVEAGAEFISHFGVKGMRWGVRKGRTPPAPTEVKAESIVKSPKNKKTKIKTEGGHNHPATEDAIKAAISQQKLAKSGHAALTNRELQELATRMNLEQQVTTLIGKKPRSPSQAVIDAALKDPVRTVQVTGKAAGQVSGLIDRTRGVPRKRTGVGFR